MLPSFCDFFLKTDAPPHLLSMLSTLFHIYAPKLNKAPNFSLSHVSSMLDLDVRIGATALSLTEAIVRNAPPLSYPRYVFSCFYSSGTKPTLFDVLV